jgi:hypothetical protein
MSGPRILEQGDLIVVGCSGCSWTEKAASHIEGFWRYFAHALGGCIRPPAPPRVSWWRRLLAAPSAADDAGRP